MGKKWGMGGPRSRAGPKYRQQTSVAPAGSAGPGRNAAARPPLNPAPAAASNPAGVRPRLHSLCPVFMKNLLLGLAALGLSAGAAFGQAPVKTTGSDANQTALHERLQAGPKPGQKATHKAGKMAEELGLSADQETRLKQLLLARQQETAALKAKYGADKKAARPALQAARARYQAQLKALLTPAQYARFEQDKDAHHGPKGAGK